MSDSLSLMVDWLEMGGEVSAGWFPSLLVAGWSVWLLFFSLALVYHDEEHVKFYHIFSSNNNHYFDYLDLL